MYEYTEEDIAEIFYKFQDWCGDRNLGPTEGAVVLVNMMAVFCMNYSDDPVGACTKMLNYVKEILTAEGWKTVPKKE